MNITSAPPSPQALAVLKALQAAVTNCLDRKQRLGQYAVIWQNGRPVKTGGGAPKAEESLGRIPSQIDVAVADPAVARRTGVDQGPASHP